MQSPGLPTGYAQTTHLPSLDEAKVHRADENLQCIWGLFIISQLKTLGAMGIFNVQGRPENKMPVWGSVRVS